MLDLLYKVQNLRRHLREGQFSRYVRQAQEVQGNLAAFLEQLESGGGFLLVPGEDLHAVELELAGLLGDARGYAAVRCAGVRLVGAGAGPELDPASVLVVAEMVIRFVQFVKEVRGG
jgi:hypothetical protein